MTLSTRTFPEYSVTGTTETPLGHIMDAVNVDGTINLIISNPDLSYEITKNGKTYSLYGGIDVYNISNGEWSRKGETISNFNSNSNFGKFIKLSKNGDSFITTNGNHIEKYDWNGSKWIFKTSIEISNSFGELQLSNIDASRDDLSYVVCGTQKQIQVYNAQLKEWKIFVYKLDTDNKYKLIKTILYNYNQESQPCSVSISDNGLKFVVGIFKFKYVHSSYLPQQVKPSVRELETESNGSAMVFQINGSSEVQTSHTLQLDEPYNIVYSTAAIYLFTGQVKISGDGNTIWIPINRTFYLSYWRNYDRIYEKISGTDNSYPITFFKIYTFNGTSLTSKFIKVSDHTNPMAGLDNYSTNMNNSRSLSTNFKISYNGDILSVIQVQRGKAFYCNYKHTDTLDRITKFLEVTNLKNFVPVYDLNYAIIVTPNYKSIGKIDIFKYVEETDNESAYWTQKITLIEDETSQVLDDEIVVNSENNKTVLIEELDIKNLPDTAHTSTLGSSISMSSDGSIIVVGDSGKDNNTGSVSIYKWSNYKWTKTSELVAPDASVEHKFGQTVVLSGDGNTLLVGSPNHSTDSGKVYIYRFNGSSWDFLTTKMGEPNELLGLTMAINYLGNKIILKSFNGKIYIYEIQIINISLVDTLDETDGKYISASYDFNTVALFNTNYVKIYTDFNNNLENFVMIDSNGVEINKMTLSGDGNTVAVWKLDGIYIYRNNGTEYTLVGQLPNESGTTDSDLISLKLSNNGNVIIIGSNNNFSKVYYYNQSYQNWQQLGLELRVSALNVDISANGSIIMVSNPFDSPVLYDNNNSELNYSGVVQVFKYINSAGRWTQDMDRLSLSLYNNRFLMNLYTTIILGNETITDRISAIKSVFDKYNEIITINNTNFPSDESNVQIELSKDLLTSFENTTQSIVNNIDLITNNYFNMEVIEDPYEQYDEFIDTNLDSLQSVINNELTSLDNKLIEMNNIKDNVYFSTLNKLYENNEFESQRLLTTNTNDTLDSSGFVLQGTNNSDWYGFSTSMSADGQSFVVGAPASDEVYMYVWDPYTSSWSNVAQLQGDADSKFGYDVKLTPDGHTLVVSSDNGTSVYKWNGDVNSSSDPVKLHSTVPVKGKICISTDSNIIMGTQGTSDSHLNPPVYEYNYVNNEWTLRTNIGQGVHGVLNGDTELHSHSNNVISMSADGGIVAVISNNLDAFIYRWNLEEYVNIGSISNCYSIDLSFNGELIAVSYFSDYSTFSGTKGSVKVYKWNMDMSNSTWNQIGNTISGTLDGEMVGRTIKFASHAMVLAVASGYDYISTWQFLFGGDFTSNESVPIGKVKLYAYDSNTTTWKQSGKEIVSDINGRAFGNSLSLSSNGQIVCIGVPRHITNNSTYVKGTVKLFAFERSFGVGGSSGLWSSDSTSMSTNFEKNQSLTTVYDKSNYASLLNEANSLQFRGSNIAMSTDSGNLAIGDPVKQTISVYNFDKNSNKWVFVDSIVRKGHSYKHFGKYVRFAGNSLVTSYTQFRTFYDLLFPTNNKLSVYKPIYDTNVKNYVFKEIQTLQQPYPEDENTNPIMLGETMSVSNTGNAIVYANSEYNKVRFANGRIIRKPQYAYAYDREAGYDRYMLFDNTWETKFISFGSYLISYQFYNGNVSVQRNGTDQMLIEGDYIGQKIGRAQNTITNVSNDGNIIVVAIRRYFGEDNKIDDKPSDMSYYYDTPEEVFSATGSYDKKFETHLSHYRDNFFGKIYIFQWQTTEDDDGNESGSYVNVLTLNGTKSEHLGGDIALSGNGQYLAYSSTNENNNATNKYVKLIKFNNSENIDSYTEIETFRSPISYDNFGSEIELSNNGTTLAINAPTANNMGYVKIYKNTGNDNWLQFGNVIDNQILNVQNTRSIIRLSPDGRTLVYVLNTPENSKRIYTFTYKNGSWFQGYFRNNSELLTLISAAKDEEEALEQKNYSDKLILPDPQNIFVNSEDIDGTNFGQELGQSVNTIMYNDYMYMAVSSKRQTIYGMSNNSIRVYYRNINDANSEWEQLGNTIISGNVSGFGTSISMMKNYANHILTVNDPYNARVITYKFNESTNEWDSSGSNFDATRAGISYSFGDFGIHAKIIPYPMTNITNYWYVGVLSYINNSTYVSLFQTTDNGSEYTLKKTVQLSGVIGRPKSFAYNFMSNEHIFAVGDFLGSKVSVISINNNSDTVVESSITNSDNTNSFGFSLDISSGGMIAIGDPFYTQEQKQVGRIRTYYFNTGTKQFNTTYTEVTGDTTSNKRLLGHSVSLHYGSTNHHGLSATGSLTQTDHTKVTYFYKMYFGWKLVGDPIVSENSSPNGQSTEQTTLTDISSISISNSVFYLVIGDRYNDVGNSQDNYNAGHVRVLKYNGTVWTQEFNPASEPLTLTESEYNNTKDITGNNINDKFGSRVIMSKDSTTMGSVYKNGNVGVHRLNYVNGLWKQLGDIIESSDSAKSSSKLVSLAMSHSGNTIAIGSPADQDANNTNSDSGRVYIYEFSNNMWTLSHTFYGSWDQTTTGQLLGTAVSMSDDGKIVAMSKPGTQNGQGAVDIYSYESDNWNLSGSISGTQPEGQFGNKIALSSDGTVLTITDESTNNGGLTSVYYYNGSSWQAKGSDIPKDPTSTNVIPDVDISDDGSRVAISSIDNTNTGKVRTFKYNEDTNNWTQESDTLSGSSANDGFGTSISLSNDGSVIAVGVPNTANGLVQVFGLSEDSETSSTSFKQIGKDIEGTSSNDKLGSSVSLSSINNSIAVGLPNSGDSKGSVKVFKYAPGVWSQNILDIDNPTKELFLSVQTDDIEVTEDDFSELEEVVTYGTITEDEIIFNTNDINTDNTSYDNASKKFNVNKIMNNSLINKFRGVSRNERNSARKFALYNLRLNLVNTYGITFEEANVTIIDTPVSDLLLDDSITTTVSARENSNVTVYPSGSTINVNDLNGGAVYVELDNSHDNVTINTFTENKWFYIENNGMDQNSGNVTYTLNTDEGIISNIVEEGYTGVYDNFNYVVGSLTGTGTDQAVNQDDSTHQAICILKGCNIKMGDNSYKKVEDVTKGDLLMTQNGPREVVDIFYKQYPNISKHQPYKVGKALMSPNHVVSVNNKLMFAKNVGEQVYVNSETIEYYNFRTSGGIIEDLICVDGLWCESWDGYDWGVSPFNKNYLLTQNPKTGECIRYKLDKIQY